MAQKLTMQHTCDPLDARMYFKSRAIVNWIIALGVFAPLIFILQSFLPYALSDLIGIAVVGALFFYVLDKRQISITCPSCGGHIDGRTPWVCGVCKKTNFNTAKFSFLGRCENDACRAEPKAIKCRHCWSLVLLTKDEQRSFYAQCVDQPEEPNRTKPIEKDIHAETLVEKQKDIQIKQLEIEQAKLELSLKGLRENLTPVKVPTIGERLRSKINSRFELENEAALLKREYAIEFKDDPVELKRRCTAIDVDVIALLPLIKK